MRAGRLAISAIAIAPILAGCNAEPPEWVGADGWHAARCEEATQILLEGGDESMSETHEAWHQTTVVFWGTTDGGMELSGRASAAVSSFFDGNAKARRFVAENCGAESLARIRRDL